MTEKELRRKYFEDLDVGAEKIGVIDCILSEKDGRDLASNAIYSCKKTFEKIKEQLTDIVKLTLIREGRQIDYIDAFLIKNSFDIKRTAKSIIGIVTERGTNKENQE